MTPPRFVFRFSLKFWVFFSLYTLASVVFGCRVLHDDQDDYATFDSLASTPDGRLNLGPDEGVVTVIGTNDIHGGVEDSQSRGGAYNFSGYVEAVRRHTQSQFGDRGKVLLLDAGDSFQGTLLSNFSEGVIVGKIMRELRYTAVIPGNHGFDFGPLGWKDDTCGSRTPCDPLGALKQVIAASDVPWLAGNITVKDTDPPKTPEFFKPYLLIPFMGRNIAVIGLEDVRTPYATNQQNVEGLKFGALGSLAYHVETLWNEGKADIFVGIYHGGDASGGSAFKAELERLYPAEAPEPKPVLMVAGHTHIRNHNVTRSGIPYMQSFANGQYFGIAELVVKKGSDGRLVPVRNKTKMAAGLRIENNARFYGQNLRDLKNENISRLVDEGRNAIRSIAEERLATIQGTITPAGGREGDSEMGNLLTDLLRASTGTDVALINNGHIRKPFGRGNLGPQNTITFENLFNVMPSSDRVVRFDQVPTDLLARNIMRSMRSCGARGVLEISGMKVEFNKHVDCNGAKEDFDAKLAKLTLDNGTVIWEDSREGGASGDQIRRSYPCPRTELPCLECVKVPTVSVATIDFVWDGGAGYCHFEELAPTEVGETLRDVLATELKRMRSIRAAAYPTGRYVNLHESANPGR